MTSYDALYNAAVERKHPEPSKMAETTMRYCEKYKQMKQARHKIVVLTTAPPPPVTEVPAKKSAAPQCTAKNLEGRQCSFRAAPGCGTFCKKHYHMV